MNKYEITVKETCHASYIVEANTAAEAQELFSEWADKHTEIIGDDLMDGAEGWEYRYEGPASDMSYADIPYREVKV